MIDIYSTQDWLMRCRNNAVKNDDDDEDEEMNGKRMNRSRDGGEDRNGENGEKMERKDRRV